MPGKWIKAKVWEGTVRRFVFFAAVAFWLGGFTFYSGVVIPIGSRILGGHLRQGLITQEVSRWLNVSAAVALVVMVWDMWALWRDATKVNRRVLATTWIAMAVLQVGLFGLHPAMDGLVDLSRGEILDQARFDVLHHIYLWGVSVQWGAGVIHVWGAMSVVPQGQPAEA